MFRNYLTVALRNLVRNKLYSVITLSGLAVGLACAVFIILFVRDELSYDRWLPGTEGLYQLEMTVKAPASAPRDDATVQFMLPVAMREEIPEVTDFVRLQSEYMTFNRGSLQFGEPVSVVDPNFFAMLRLPMASGDPNRVLTQPQSVVLSETAARKYFGDTNPLGQILTVSRPDCLSDTPPCPTDAIALTVTGVFKDIPHNSQLAANIVIPNTSVADRYPLTQKQDWLENNTYGYIRLSPGADPQEVLAKLDPILDREATAGLLKFNVREAGRAVFRPQLTPFRRVHLDGARYAQNLTPPGSWATVYGVIAIGMLIMLMACFNFMNLATAQATLRAREIAVRKAFGARRSQLIVQFLGEAVLIALLALVLAMALVEMLLPAVDNFLEKPLALNYLTDWPLVLLVIVVATTAGLLSGSYPALILSGFRSASVLRGGGGGKGGSRLLRSALVVVQFAVSIVLGIATLVVFSQISHARSIDLGFRHDNTILLYTGSLSPASRESLLQELARNPGVEAVAQSGGVPFGNNAALGVAQVPGRSDQITMSMIDIGSGFRALYGMPLIAGRDLTLERADDQSKPGSTATGHVHDGQNVVVNAAAAARLGRKPSELVGKPIVLDGYHIYVVGVMGDSKFSGAREPVKPTIYYFDPYWANVISIRIRPASMSETLAFIDKTWKSFSSTMTSSRRHLDDDINGYYRTEERQGQMFGVFVGLAILIAILGLFGLAAFTAGRRTREIGIRKAFGASTTDVILLLLRQFSVPVLIANVIAWPIAWRYLTGWLQGFADRITLSPLYFLGVGAVALVIAWATVFVHAWRVARANPIHALRYE